MWQMNENFINNAVVLPNLNENIFNSFVDVIKTKTNANHPLHDGANLYKQGQSGGNKMISRSKTRNHFILFFIQKHTRAVAFNTKTPHIMSCIIIRVL